MTFKNLQKVIQSQQSGPEQSQLLQRLRGKPFWIWNPTQHKQDIKTKGDCCFNHIIGLPTNTKVCSDIQGEANNVY